VFCSTHILRSVVEGITTSLSGNNRNFSIWNFTELHKSYPNVPKTLVNNSHLDSLDV